MAAESYQSFACRKSISCRFALISHRLIFRASVRNTTLISLDGSVHSASARLDRF
jgi:hypothetical protein